MRTGLLAFVGAVALSGCALLGKSDPVVPRYFTPEYEGGARAPQLRSDLQLRLGRVEGWSHLRERFVVRSSAREIVQREDLLWLERPEVYLRRALARTLFEERGVVEVLSGRAVTLEVELIAFEEVAGPQRARLEAHVLLRDDRTVLLTETVTVEQPVEGNGEAEPARAVVLACSLALRTGVTRIADRVLARLAGEAELGSNGGGR